MLPDEGAMDFQDCDGRQEVSDHRVRVIGCELDVMWCDKPLTVSFRTIWDDGEIKNYPLSLAEAEKLFTRFSAIMAVVRSKARE